jgi:hypothetical protein
MSEKGYGPPTPITEAFGQNNPPPLRKVADAMSQIDQIPSGLNSRTSIETEFF